MQSEQIAQVIQSFYPDVQGVYLFGSHASDYERIDSDIDIAVLLPHLTAKKAGDLTLGHCWQALNHLSNKSIDLINLRLANTVFQHEIIHTGQLILNNDQTAVDEFEMLCMSFYQKLNEERREIIVDIIRQKRILAVPVLDR